MDINIIDVILFAILAISTISGMYKGFIASGLAAVGFVAALFGAMNLFPQVSQLVLSNTSLMNALDYYLDPSTLFTTSSLASTPVTGAIQSGALTQALKELNLPSAVESAFQNSVSQELFKSLNLSTLADYLGQTIWVSVVNVLSFLVMFAVCYFVVLLVVNLLNNIFRFPLLKHFDWLLGGVFGLGRGAVVVMLILSILPMVLSAMPFTAVQDLLNTSTIAQMLPSNVAIPTIISMAFQTT